MSQNLKAVASMLPKILYSGQIANANTDNTLYTVGGATSAIVKHGVITNVNAAGGATVTVTLRVIPSGGSVDATHIVINAYPLAAADTLSLRDYLANCNLGPGDTIHAQASVANVIDILITGVEST